MATNDRVVLLFCHGGSYTKETWAPITKRLQATPLLQRVACEIVAFDWSYHGEKYDHSDTGQLVTRDGISHSKRVEHRVKYWPEWSQPVLDEKIREIRGATDRTTRIIGIGHSIGGGALLQYEVDHPGTFEALIGFEPIYDNGVLNDEQVHGARDMLVAVSLAREGEWASQALAVEHIKSHKTFRRWHPEALEAYVNSAIVQTADNRWKLALPPMQEAATFCHEFIQLPAEKLARAKCPLFFEPAERSFFFYPQSARALAEKVGEKVVVGEPIPKTSHVMVHEDPDACAQRIAEDLAQLPLFQ